MTRSISQEHWDGVWAQDDGSGRSWFQSSPQRSLDLIKSVTTPSDSVIDVGGGSSQLVDELLKSGYHRPAVVDITNRALDHSRRRLGQRADQVDWVAKDVKQLDLGRRFAVWHDRAVLHFLVTRQDRSHYLDALNRHLEPHGHVILATFSPNGPTTCSGLDVRRYDADEMQHFLGPSYTLLHAEVEEHSTPAAAVQEFTWGVFHRSS